MHSRRSHCCKRSAARRPACLCSRPATTTRRPRPPSPSARCRSSASPSKTRTRRANSSAWCARATRPISASASPARSSRRVVNVGDRVNAGDVVARLDPQDLKLQVESARGRVRRRDLEPRAGRRRPRALHHAEDARLRVDRRLRSQEGGQGRGRRARSSARKRALDLARNQLAYADLKADADGVITATLAEPGQVVAIGQAVARLAHRGEKEAVVALPETWLGEARKSKATVRLWSDPRAQLHGAAARALAAGRCRDPHLCGALHHRESRRRGRARHDRDGDAVARRRCVGREAAARGDPQSRHRPVGLCGRRRPARSSCGR